MANHFFQFKQFRIQQQNCAMKVGTDSILLGAWVNVSQTTRILDLGTGTGLLALMLAQRTAQAQIIGVEIDPLAAKQAQDNVANSPWADRIRIVRSDIAQFAQQHRQRFDCIVANPPYFNQGVDCRNDARNTARYLASQTHLDWLNIAYSCLTEQGHIHFVLPVEQGEWLKQHSPLPYVAQCLIRSKQAKPPNRILLCFSPQAMPCEQTELIIHQPDNQYTAEFKQRTQAFYFNF